MGIIKKNTSNSELNQENNQVINKSKIFGNVIKQEFLNNELVSLNLEPENFSKKIIKRQEVTLPVNEVIEEIKDVNIVGKSIIEYELEEEKTKYQNLSQELQAKIEEYNIKLQEIEKEKNLIIENAKKESELMIQKAIQEAQNKAKEILQQAYNKGLQKGIQEASVKIEEEYTQKIQELTHEINNIINLRSNLVKEFEKEIIELVFDVAEKILNKKIEESNSVVISYLSELLSKVERSKTVTIWVSPRELEEVRNHKEKLQYILEDVENLNIVPDERIEKGGCVIETNFGKIDSRLSTKIEVLKEIILRAK